MSPVDSDRNVIQPVFQGSIPRQVTPKKQKTESNISSIGCRVVGWGTV